MCDGIQFAQIPFWDFIWKILRRFWLIELNDVLCFDRFPGGDRDLRCRLSSHRFSTHNRFNKSTLQTPSMLHIHINYDSHKSVVCVSQSIEFIAFESTASAAKLLDLLILNCRKIDDWTACGFIASSDNWPRRNKPFRSFVLGMDDSIRKREIPINNRPVAIHQFDDDHNDEANEKTSKNIEKKIIATWPLIIAIGPRWRS